MNNSQKITAKLRLVDVFEAALEVAEDDFRQIKNRKSISEIDRDIWISDRAGDLLIEFRDWMKS